MLSCKELVARSSDFLDKQLSFRQRLAVRRHLLACKNCRRFIKQMRLSQAVLRQLPQGQNAELDSLATKLAELRRQHS
ncbi:MAG TPA: zf-HC2 domain-containing protein [Pseudomonas sp.]|nr:zf-HC2 domain-containing protein [Pseudomonas sp.]